MKIRAEDGNDTITIGGGTGHIVYGGAGADTVTVYGGNNSEIRTGDGADIINITGGSGHTVLLGEGTNTVTVSAKNVTLQQDSELASDTITVKWSNNLGTLKIDTKDNYGGYNTDTLKITGANSDAFTFTKGSLADTLVLSSAGSRMEISGWKTNAAFSSGITFDNKTVDFVTLSNNL